MLTLESGQASQLCVVNLHAGSRLPGSTSPIPVLIRSWPSNLFCFELSSGLAPRRFGGAPSVETGGIANKPVSEFRFQLPPDPQLLLAHAGISTFR